MECCSRGRSRILIRGTAVMDCSVSAFIVSASIMLAQRRALYTRASSCWGCQKLQEDLREKTRRRETENMEGGERKGGGERTKTVYPHGWALLLACLGPSWQVFRSKGTPGVLDFECLHRRRNLGSALGMREAKIFPCRQL